MGLSKEKLRLRAMLNSAESIFYQFVAEYLRKFETKFENILGY
jgi:hypothetical protein